MFFCVGVYGLCKKKGIRYANDCVFTWLRVSPFPWCAPVYSVDSLSTVLCDAAAITTVGSSGLDSERCVAIR